MQVQPYAAEKRIDPWFRVPREEKWGGELTTPDDALLLQLPWCLYLSYVRDAHTVCFQMHCSRIWSPDTSWGKACYAFFLFSTTKNDVVEVRKAQGYAFSAALRPHKGLNRGLTSTLTLWVNSNYLLFSSFVLYYFFYFPLYFISPPFYWNEPAFPNNCLGCCCKSVNWILYLS